MPVSAALDARGLKRVCVSCGIRFYDLNKRPIHCPNCQAEFSGEIKLKGRRGRAAAEAEAEVLKAKAVVPVANDDQNTDVETREEGVVSLEDVEAMENAGGDSEDDIEMEDDDIGGLEEIEEDDEEIAVPADKDKE